MRVHHSVLLRPAAFAAAFLLSPACGGGDRAQAPAAQGGGAPAPAAGASAERLVPAPGAELGAPPAAPPRAGRAPGAKLEPLDLGKDRPPVKLDIPVPPRGGAVPFELPDGQKGWVARIPDANQLPPLAYGDGKIYVSGGFESVSFYALDAKTGKMAWASQQLEDNGPTAPIFDDGRIIFNTESCTLFVMDGETGKKLWFKWLGDPTLSQPAVADGMVFASHPAPGGQRLTAYRIENGNVAWSVGVGAELLGAPVVHGDSVYATNLHGRVYRFKRKTGKRVWSKALGATSAPWVDGERLYLARRGKGKETQIVVAAGDGKLIAEQASVEAAYLGDVPTDMNDWKKVWAYEGSRPVVWEGVKYEAMGGIVQAADPATGEALWQRRWAPGPDKRSLGTVALAGPQVVVASRTGAIFGLDVDTGYTLWAYDLGKKVVAEPIVAEGWVYATTTDGTVIALQVADASLDGWHMWGGNPHHNGPVAAPAPKTASN
jgi:Ca-activated chloride channel family protein